MASQAAPTNLSELSETLYQRLVESGKWDRLARTLRKDLQACGWEDSLRSYAKDKVSQQSQPSLAPLVNDISRFAKDSFNSDEAPRKKREDIISELRRFVEEEVEE